VIFPGPFLANISETVLVFLMDAFRGTWGGEGVRKWYARAVRKRQKEKSRKAWATRRKTMVKLLVLTTMLSFAVIATSARSSAGPGKSPKEVVERFCKMDAEGKLLSPDGANETAILFVSPYSWRRDQVIVVVSDYVVRGPDLQGNSAYFTVDYHTWGQLDSSLRFTREEGSIPYRPVKDREYYDLVFTNRYNELGENGPKAVVKGPLAWRIEATPSRPHVSVDTAIRYVTEMRDKSSDLASKENADKTIIALNRLLSGAREARRANLRRTAAQVMVQFCKMDAEGKQLTSDGWQEMSALFIQPGSPRREKIIVVKDFGVSNASISEENKADVGVEYISLGQLDSRTVLFEQGSMSYIKLRGNYGLVLTDKHGKAGSNGVATKESSGPVEWRIEGPVPEPHITVDTAIRFTTELRDRASDSVTKKNAARTLAALNRLR